MAAHPLTVGFDLDMTLIDSRPGIKAAYQELSARTGTVIDADLAVSRLGPPLEEEIRHWFPEERVAEATELFRALYPEYAVAPSPAMPGARAAIGAVHTAGGRAIVVTAKYEPNARLHLEHLGLDADALVGSLWAADKAEALRKHHAQVYVGDHLGDIVLAHTAGARSVAVATGPCDTTALRQAGAEVVLADLTEFPSWLERYVAEGADEGEAAAT